MPSKRKDMNPPAAPRERGRPRAEFSPEEVEKLTRIGCTDEEIAGFFGVSAELIRLRRRDEPLFLEHYERGKSELRMSLRRRQLRAAEDGNPALLIWLGKQLLGQRDKSDHEHTGKDGQPLFGTPREEAADLLRKAMAGGISEEEARLGLLVLGVRAEDLDSVSADS